MGEAGSTCSKQDWTGEAHPEGRKNRGGHLSGATEPDDLPVKANTAPGNRKTLTHPSSLPRFFSASAPNASVLGQATDLSVPQKQEGPVPESILLQNLKQGHTLVTWPHPAWRPQTAAPLLPSGEAPGQSHGFS